LDGRKNQPASFIESLTKLACVEALNLDSKSLPERSQASLPAAPLYPLPDKRHIHV
jgi:hypothetical protein